MTAAGELLGLLAEPDRLRVVAALALGARSTEEVASRSGLPLRSTVAALRRLENGGLVHGDPAGWVLLAERFKEAARAAAPARPTDDHGAADAAQAAVLRVFFRDGRLVSVPAAHGKRRVVLDHVARVFEPGVRYSEREVDALLRAFHPDVATGSRQPMRARLRQPWDVTTLRRYLVDEGFLGRDPHGTYWRTGGTVDLR